MPGSPSLGVNFATNPFRRAAPRRAQTQEDELPANYGTGFSPDGNSYSVIDDFGKVAAQALADYEAQINNQRQQNLSLDSRGIVTAKPVDISTSDAIYNSTIAPTQRLFEGGQSSRPALRTYKDDQSGDIIGIDPGTGQGRIVFKGTPKPEPTHSPDHFPIPTELNLMQQPTGIKMMTMPQIEAILPSLPERIRTNAPATTYKNWLQSSNTPAIGAPRMDVQSGKVATKEIAAQFLQQARGDKDIARRLAREAGYSF